MLNNPIFYLSRVVWRFAESDRKTIVTYVALFVLANIVDLLQPLIIAYLLNFIQATGITRENVMLLVAFLGLFVVQDLVFWAFHGPARILEKRTAFRVRARYRQFFLRGTMALPMEWHVNHHSGDTIDKVEKGTRALYDFTEHGFQVVQSLVRFIGSLIAIAIFNLNAIFVVVLLVAVAFYALSNFDQRLVIQFKALNRAENRIAEKIFDALSNISTVIILRVEHLLQEDIKRAIMKPFSLFMENTKLNEWKWFSASVSAALLQLIILGSYALMTVYQGETIMVGALFALYSYTSRINGVFFTFAYLYNDIIRQRAAVYNAEEISADFLPVPEKTPVIHRRWEQCEVRGLNFSYDGTPHSQSHLEDIYFSFRRGEKIALIGESGSGKTTFLKIMRGLYVPSKIQVVLDGKVLGGGFSDLAHDIALIPQEPEIFATTIRENITMGVERTEAEIQTLIDLVRFTDVVRKLPRGLDSSIVEKGVNLSGGERQRLALARGLLASHDKSILLLDEATSSVDTTNELAIYEGIFATYPDKTIIATIHRLHLLHLFDTIYLFEKGRVIAWGSFDQLLKQSEKFAAEWQKYIEHRKSQ